MDTRSELLDWLDEAADEVGVSTVMQWCIEWESARADHEPTPKHVGGGPKDLGTD